SPEILATFFVPNFDLVDCVRPQWSPNGKEILFAGWDQTGRGYLYSKQVETGELIALVDAQVVCKATWAHSGSEVALSEWINSEQRWVLAILLRQTGELSRLHDLQGGFGVGQVQWSQDDDELAFVEYDYAISQAVLRKIAADGGDAETLANLEAGVAAGQ